MNITVVGTGYVGLVTATCLAEIGHQVICIDKDPDKIQTLRSGKSVIYEPGLEQMIRHNIIEGRLSFTTSYDVGIEPAQVIYIAVGTPANEDGTADLNALHKVALSIASLIKRHVTIVTKSTVPVGTNNQLKMWIQDNLVSPCTFDIVSNPEFLREGTAINDTFFGDRIIIGSENSKAADVVEEINKPFNIPVFRTTIRSAEMIKYASNAFLATKISFINEISNLCEKLDADITEVAHGMGMDKRIGHQFLNAGIGYGGSCFPKDTNALVQMAGNSNMDFDLLKSVIEVNRKQHVLLIEKAIRRFGKLSDIHIAVLGLSFKPETDDMREAASIPIIHELIKQGANVTAYDPVAITNARVLLPKEVRYAESVDEAIEGADCAFILTEWKEFINYDKNRFLSLMKQPILFDGRNCYSLNEIENTGLEYYSIGRSNVNEKNMPKISRITL
ncbi:UDP-glucose/GDP-mannose dehydrogenase family protein [Paenibacillus sp. Y412MC10]|uniref:UDP-glucose dehydrogenase family protein n=1 Tax=Geobacillus sp. (strain Y412MC10) TaxID=481743 RepID=UPI0011A4AEFF|nr:UDP-glucose/GDP-mannose dehydrogenase family protein [Paenibacillus sp. Y412MC10]